MTPARLLWAGGLPPELVQPWLARVLGSGAQNPVLPSGLGAEQEGSEAETEEEAVVASCRR